MNAILKTEHFKLEPYDSRRLANLCGQFDEHLRQIESHLQVEIRNRGNLFQLTGESDSVDAAGIVLDRLYKETRQGHELTPDKIHLTICESSQQIPTPSEPAAQQEASTELNTAAPEQSNIAQANDPEVAELSIKTRKITIKPRGLNQKQYVRKRVLCVKM